MRVDCEEALAVAVRLALAGYYASPDAVLASATEAVLACRDHLIFDSEYQDTHREMNKK